MPDSARSPVIVGIGEVLWDTFADTRRLGGAPTNFAYHARRLGAEAAVASCVGDDDDGREVRDQLRAWGLDARHLAVDPSHRTGVVTVRLDEHGVADYVIQEDAAWDFLPFDDPLRELAGRADAVCFGSLAQRGPTSRATIRRFLDSTRPDCLRVFDVNLRQSYHDREVIDHLLARSGVLKLNDQELPVVAGLLGFGGDETEILRAIRGRYGLRLVALTRGELGSRLVAADRDSEHPAESVEVIDTVGAGDAFTAALTIGLLRGDPLGQVHRRASRLAGFVCSRGGATPEIPADLLDPGE